MKKYYGNYLGIVIQNNDPEKCGKVKIFIPHLSPTVYSGWLNIKHNKDFKFLGNNIGSVITQILEGGSEDKVVVNIAEELKRILPWAECACPLASENSSGRYNNTRQIATISDSNFINEANVDIDQTDIPGKPSNFYENVDNRLEDAFVSADNNINRPNPLAYQYVPSSYSNGPKGVFGIPSVGSHVWVFFKEGDCTSPVYFATTFGREDWQTIYNVPQGGSNYPGSFENKIETEYDNNTDTYRNKFVINQKGGTVEITNTDLNEKIKLTHYSGSFKEFNNQTNIELATKNNQKLVLNDEYSTVKGFKNEHTGKSFDEIILRDKFKKVGTLNSEYYDKWKETYAIIHENKQLFEIKRAIKDNVLDSNGNIAIKRTSLMQTRSGTFATHPVTDGTNTYYAQSGTSASSNSTTTNSSSDGAISIDTDRGNSSNSYPSNTNFIIEADITWGPGGVGKSTSTQDGDWEVEDQKELIKTLIEISIEELSKIEKELGIGGSEIVQISKHKIETIGMTVNDFGSIRYDGIGKMLSSEVLIDPNVVYVHKKESPLVELVHVQDLPGGNYTINACNRMNILVGAGGLNIKSLGQTNVTGSVTNITGQQLNLASSGEINIDAKTINISAEILRLRNKNQRQVFINESLGVNNNVIIGGGLHVEGETFLQHVTAPKEYQVTEQCTLFGKFVAGQQVTISINGGADATLEFKNTGENIIECYPHSHAFANLPLTLVDGNSTLRSAATALNSGSQRSIAGPIYDKKK